MGMLNRRTFLSAFVGGLFLRSRPSEAQQARIWRIGFISSLPVPATALADALRNADLVEGQNVIIDRRVTDSPNTLPVLVGELLRFQPDVIVAFWNRDVVATREATRSIPIVMVIGVDPVGAGLVASLARPGGNVTGSLYTEPAIAGKTLQVLKEALPTVKRVAALWNPSFTLPAYYAAMEEAAKEAGITLVSVESRVPTEFDPALGLLASSRPEALFVDGLAVPRQDHRVRLIEFAARRRLPVVYTGKPWVTQALTRRGVEQGIMSPESFEEQTHASCQWKGQRSSSW